MRSLVMPLALVVVATGGACTTVDSEEEARLAYLGIDKALERAVQLGFDGFNAADSANIPAQSDDGDDAGTMEVTGQVDQGASANKGMRLNVVLTDYSDGPIDDPETEDVEEELAVVYNTLEGGALRLELQLKDIPDGDLSGELTGSVTASGDIEGDLFLDISITADIEAGEGEQRVQRVEGTTRITGTATSEAGEYQVDVTR